MRRSRLLDSDDLAIKAAYLKAECRLLQGDIARRLSLGQATVSRLLRRAVEELHCLETVERFVRIPRIDDQKMAELERLLEYADLADTLKGLPTATGLRLRALRVFNCGSADGSPAGIDARQRAFGHAVAPHLAERLRQARHVGVAWGSTLSRVVDGLARLGFPWQNDPAARVFVPVTAEPMQFARSEHTASVLARRLHVLVNGEDEGVRPQLSLTGVPAFIPYDPTHLVPGTKRLARKHRDLLSRGLKEFFVNHSPAYRAIFTEPDALIGRLDTLLTAAGPARRVMGFCNDDLLSSGHLDRGELQRLVVGDLGGVLLTRPTRSKTAEPTVDRLRSMWTGISREQLEAIARRAAEKGDGTPGVILMTIGEDRAEVVAEALTQGLCTELLIDDELAQCLKREFARRVSSATQTRGPAAGRGQVAPARRPAP